ncbi:MAG: outer membrane protein assembly factor BamB family protein, partial [Planctomycetota bacterium]
MRRVLAAAVAASALWPSIALAAPQDQKTWSVTDYEEVRSELAEAERLLTEGLADRAIPRLQLVIDKFPDFLVADPADPNRFVGARAWTLRRIRTMTPEQRRIYEAKYGPVAERELERALAVRDLAALESVADRYLLAGDAGPRALLALADLHFASGSPGRAVGPLETLLHEFPTSAWAGPQVAARLVRARTLSGDAEGLQSMKERLAGEPGPTVRLGDREVPLGTLVDEGLAAATTTLGRRNTLTLGGDRARRGTGPALPSLGAPRWSQLNPRFNWTRYDHKQDQMESSVSQAMRHSEPVVPAIADGLVYLHWNFDLFARDLYTGKAVWHFRTPRINSAENGRTHGSLLLSPTVNDGVVYAALQTWPRGANRQTVWFANQVIIPHIPVRRLYALDAASGRPLWNHADPRDPDDPFSNELRWLNVTSAPLVVGDTIIAAGATYNSGFMAWAFAADKRTGEVLWTTRLGSGQQELNLFGRPVKEVPVASVASDGRHAWVRTNLGLVACVEVASGRMAWVRGYDQVPIPYYQNFWSTPERRFTFTGAPPVLADDAVICAPADGRNLLVLEADSGKVRWTTPAQSGRRMRRAHHWRLLGADDKRVFLAGTSIRAINLRSKALAWPEKFFDRTREEEVSGGRGVIAGKRLYVPSTHGLYVIDTETGKTLHKEPFREEGGRERRRGGGGNLVTSEGAAVLSRLYRIEGYFRPEDVRDRAVARANANPRDPEALLEAARIFLAADRPKQAIPYLERAVDAAAALPAEERELKERAARDLLFEVWVDEGRRLDREGKALEAAGAFRTASARSPDPVGAVA